MPTIPSIDRFSFWLGFIIAAVSWLVISRIAKIFPSLLASWRKSQEANQQRRIAGIRFELCQDIYRQVQKMHLANSLFSLDEIAIEPRLIAPPIAWIPGNPALVEHLGHQTIPYLPDWPEVSAPFFLPTLSMAQAAANGVKIAVIGQPGQGKSFALAYLTSLIASQDPKSETLANSLPILFHIHEIEFQTTAGKNPLDLVIKLFLARSRASLRGKIPSYVHKSAEDGKLVLLIDGLDELPPQELDQAVALIRDLIQKYPAVKLYVAANPDYMDGLILLNFIPLAVASWPSTLKQEYIRKWSELWQIHILPHIKQAAADADPRLFAPWISSGINPLTPFDLTLHTWLSFSGEEIGTTSLSRLNSYINTITRGRLNFEALAVLAQELINNGVSGLPIVKAEEILNRAIRQRGESSSMIQTDTSATGKIPSMKKPGQISSGGKMLAVLIDAGLLVEYSANTIGFRFPQITAFFASQLPLEFKTAEWKSWLQWSTKNQCLRYGVIREKGSWIKDWIAVEDAPLYRNYLALGRWLPDIPLSAEWRSDYMRELVHFLQQDTLPLGLRAKIISICVLANDPSSLTLLKQFMISPRDSFRQIAAIGTAVGQEPKLINDLIELLGDREPSVRQMACLAFTSLKHPASLNILAEIFLHGEEQMRQIIAESFASNANQGHEILKESITDQDLLTRRAAVIGLSLVNEPWALQLLEKASVEDSQWVIRNAAGQTLENSNQPYPYIPVVIPPPSEAEWLIRFAGKIGIGVIPGQMPIELLLKTLNLGTDDEKILALDYLLLNDEEGVAAAFFDLYYREENPVREAVLVALWKMSARGYQLPPPARFGYL